MIKKDNIKVNVPIRLCKYNSIIFKSFSSYGLKQNDNIKNVATRRVAYLGAIPGPWKLDIN